MVPFIASILIYMIPRNPGNHVMGHTIYAISIFSKRPFLQGPYQQWLTSFVRRPPQCPGAAQGGGLPSLNPGSWGVLMSRGEPHLARYAPIVFDQNYSQI